MKHHVCSQCGTSTECGEVFDATGKRVWLCRVCWAALTEGEG